MRSIRSEIELRIIVLSLALLIAVIFISNRFGGLKATSKFKDKQIVVREKLFDAYQKSIGKLAGVIRNKLRK